MLVQFLGNSTFISHHAVTVAAADAINGILTLPIDRDNVDVNTLQVKDDHGNAVSIEIPDGDVASVYKDGNATTGILQSYDDRKAVVRSGDDVTVIRNYDAITIPKVFVVIVDPVDITSVMELSYMATGITASVVHRVDTEAHTLKSSLIVENHSSIDLLDANIEIDTAEQIQNHFYETRVSMASPARAMVEEDGEIGGSFVVNGAYDVSPYSRLTIPIIDETVSVGTFYSIAAPNGNSHARYVMLLKAPIDIPAGNLYVYRNGEFEGNDHIGSIGANERVEIPLITVPSVFADGMIDIQHGNEGEEITRVTISGTITNGTNFPAYVQLTYPIGNSHVEMISDGDRNAEISKENIVFPYIIDGHARAEYDHVFVVYS